MNPLFSIIIPVFNTLSYLKACISSIQNQSFANFEIILVDDGSTDGSATMCDTYATKDDRVKVIHKENGGVSSARNLALEKSVGNYIVFVDSDDYLRHDALEILHSTIHKTNCELILFDILSVTPSGTPSKSADDTITKLPISQHVSKNEFLKDPNLLYQCAGGVPRTVIRRDIIDVIHATFPVGIPFSEDRIFLLKVLAHIKTMYYLKVPLYYRVQREDSAVHEFRDNYLELDELVLNRISQVIETDWNSNPDILKEYELSHIQSCYYAGTIQFHHDNRCNLRQKLNNIKDIANDATLRRLLEKHRLRDTRALLIRAKSKILLPCLFYLSYLKLKYGYFLR